MSDLLSAASLLLGVIAILFGLWYPEITRAIELPKPDHKEDYKKPYKEVSAVFYSRAIPLTVASSLLTLVFASDAIKISCLSLREYLSHGWGAINNYSAVLTSFVLVVCLSFALTIYLFYYTHKLFKKWKSLKP
jgi:hypothetical protein